MKVLSAWQQALTQQRLLFFFILGYILTVIITYLSPIILAHVQARQGVVLNDYLLANISSVDCSDLIFFVLYLQIGWMLIRSYQMPVVHIELVWAFLFFYTFRFITIWFTPLEPPLGLIVLQDPFAKIFIYDHAVITKDLFFSGHVGFAFVVYLFLPKPIEKSLGLLVVIIVAILILIQHVHYTIDVVAAPFFGYLSYFLAKKLVTGKV